MRSAWLRTAVVLLVLGMGLVPTPEVRPARAVVMSVEMPVMWCDRGTRAGGCCDCAHEATMPGGYLLCPMLCGTSVAVLPAAVHAALSSPSLDRPATGDARPQRAEAPEPLPPKPAAFL